MSKSLNKAYISLGLVSFFWGTTYLATRIGVEYAHGLMLSCIRQLIAGVCLVSFFVLQGHQLPNNAKDWLHISIIGVVMLCVANGLMCIGLQYIPSGLCAILAATGPIWTVLFSHFMLQPVQLSWRLGGGLLIGFLGIVGIFYDYLGDLLKPEFTLGIVLTLLASMGWAYGSILSAKWKSNIHAGLGSGIQMIAGGLVMVVITAIMGWDNMVFGHWGIEFWGSIAYLVIGGSFIGYFGYVYCLANLPPAQVSIYAYVNPIVAILLGWVILSEKLTVWTWLAMVVVLLGVYLVNSAFQEAKKKVAVAE